MATHAPTIIPETTLPAIPVLDTIPYCCFTLKRAPDNVSANMIRHALETSYQAAIVCDLKQVWQPVEFFTGDIGSFVRESFYKTKDTYPIVSLTTLLYSFNLIK